jgi:hypothetical protein
VHEHRTQTYTYPPPPPPNAGQGRPGARRGRPAGAQEPPDLTTPTGGLVGRNGNGPGGSTIHGYRARTGVNRDLLEADVNIEFQSGSEMAEESMKLAFFFKAAADAYTTDYPATVGPHMTNTDSGRFQDIVPSISLRENERGAQTGGGWNPTWHTPLDVWTTFTDDDFRLGLNAAQVTLSALAQLTSARVGAR